MTKRRTTTDIDKIIGARIRVRREAKNLTIQQLGEKVGISGTQLGKYERHLNSISGGRLLLIARALEVPINYFYEGLCDMDSPILDPELHNATFELVTRFMQIKDTKQQASLRKMIKVLADLYQPPLEEETKYHGDINNDVK